MNNENLLVGYVRKTNAGSVIKLSLNTKAFDDCEIYTTSDGQSYVSLHMKTHDLRKVIDGLRSVSTVYQERSE